MKLVNLVIFAAVAALLGSCSSTPNVTLPPANQAAQEAACVTAGMTQYNLQCLPTLVPAATGSPAGIATAGAADAACLVQQAALHLADVNKQCGVTLPIALPNVSVSPTATPTPTK